MNDCITKEDLLEIIKSFKSADKEVPVLSKEEVEVLKEIIKDRHAMSRVWNWLLYALGGLSTLIVAYGVITGSIFDWLKNHLAK